MTANRRGRPRQVRSRHRHRPRRPAWPRRRWPAAEAQVVSQVSRGSDVPRAGSFVQSAPWRAAVGFGRAAGEFVCAKMRFAAAAPGSYVRGPKSFVQKTPSGRGARVRCARNGRMRAVRRHGGLSSLGSKASHHLISRPWSRGGVDGAVTVFGQSAGRWSRGRAGRGARAQRGRAGAGGGGGGGPGGRRAQQPAGAAGSGSDVARRVHWCRPAMGAAPGFGRAGRLFVRAKHLPCWPGRVRVCAGGNPL